MGTKPATAPGGHPRMNFAPGSFDVIVVGPETLAG